MITPTLFKQEAERSGGSGGARSKVALAHNIHLDMLEGDIALVTFDHPTKSANIFDARTLVELEVAVKAVTRLRAKGLVFMSSKPTIFIAGADLEALATYGEEELDHLIRKGQEIFQSVADLKIPTVVAINGACLGGGLELSLACDVRIATDDKSTKIGLPETMLGILPAWGGSTRLPRLVGLPTALDLILGGKQLAAKHALKLGVVDRVVPKERLREVALETVAKTLPERKSHFLTNNPLSAAAIRKIVKKKTLDRSRGNYPALEESIEVVTRGGFGSIAESLEREREAVLRLSATEAAKNLMRVFRLQEGAKKFRYDTAVNPRELEPITSTAVIGAGVMGSGIAQWFAARGMPIILRDIDEGRVAAGMKSVKRLFDSAVKKRIFTSHDAKRRMDLVAPSATPVSLAGCDLVVEAAVEDLAIKKTIFADLCERSSEKTILATNTSALPISELCEAPGVTHPERIVGLHFFNPVSRMKLVEIVVTEHTSPEVVESMLAFVRKIGKLPVVVKDSPGFLVNRILMPYLIEAGKLVDRGYKPEVIDEAMLNFGMPMGPIRLLDEVGLDVAAHVGGTMREAFGDRFELPSVLTALIKDGRLGRKTGHGFYEYEKGKALRDRSFAHPPEQMTRSEIASYLVNLMVDEARLCLKEGVVKTADEIDLAMILGTGFAPFRGGPMAFAGDTKTV